MEENTSTPKSSMPIVPIVIVGVLLLGGLFFFMTKGTSKTSQQNTVPTQSAENPTAEPSNVMKAEGTPAVKAGELKTFTVKGKSFSFTPNEIRVNKGDTVKIVFENTGGLHDFVIDEFNVKTKQISDGQTETVEFVADKAGTYEYYCSVGQHRQMGMKGNLIVQ